jgi:hypothetical protein
VRILTLNHVADELLAECGLIRVRDPLYSAIGVDFAREATS